VPTIFSTHTEGRNNYEVLENCTTTRNLWEKSIEMDYKEAVSRWGEWGVWGAYTDLIWLEMGSSAAITDKDDKVGQAIPTICTYNWQTLKLYYHKKTCSPTCFGSSKPHSGISIYKEILVATT